ncbi:MBL fold metallo-hydrolase [candidate division KSB1 bacterium]|nr:MBL fold metallo-hydrolase [candidate division KSB1 bacterium]
MKITHYLYNTFLIEAGNKKIAIDPGALFMYYFRFTTLIPKSEWQDITHILVTHGDPDHHWNTDRVAHASNAPVICNQTMVRDVAGKRLMLGPRDKGLAFTTAIDNLRTISVDQTIQIDGLSVTGLRATHGPLTLKIGPFSKTITPDTDERVGWGAIGFKIQLNGKTIVNLGDTLLLLNEWKTIKSPDVLMIPIGGGAIHNTMDVTEALQAVNSMQPKVVIPCHYNCPALFSKKYNPADDKMFQKEVEKSGVKCRILSSGESMEI